MSKKIKYSLDLFCGQFVEIITTVQVTAVYTTDENSSEKSKPLVITGTFLGHDEENVYIGDEEAISDAVQKHQIVNIGITKTVDKYDELLDSADDKTGFHT
jgi:hypothetical protein